MNTYQPAPRDMELRLKEQGLMLTRLRREREGLEEDLVAAQLSVELQGTQLLKLDESRSRARAELSALKNVVAAWHWRVRPAHKDRFHPKCAFCHAIRAAENGLNQSTFSI